MSGAVLIAEAHGGRIYHAAWPALLAELDAGVPDGAPVCDALIVDAPYSEKTHAGHDSGVSTADRAKRGTSGRSDMRAKLTYPSWSFDEVRSFVAAWAPRTRGWFASITDHVLAPIWSEALEASGRYVFAPLAYVAPGSRVRMVGDGPPLWSCQIVVARPRAAPWNKWATEEARAARLAAPLPGAYILPPGESEKMAVVGGKPLWLMRRLVEDYSAPGDLVCDPCCGDGTTIRAAQEAGRRGVGGDILEAHAIGAAARIMAPVQRALIRTAATAAEQLRIPGAR